MRSSATSRLLGDRGTRPVGGDQDACTAHVRGLEFLKIVQDLFLVGRVTELADVVLPAGAFSAEY